MKKNLIATLKKLLKIFSSLILMKSLALLLLFFGTIMIVSGYLKHDSKRKIAQKTKVIYKYIPKPLSALLDDPPPVDNMFRQIAGTDPWMDSVSMDKKNFNLNDKPGKIEQEDSVPDYFCDVCNKCMYKEISITEDGKTTKKYKKRNSWNLCKPICLACKNTNYLKPKELIKKVDLAHQSDFRNSG